MMLPWQKRPLALNSPRDLPGLALWLDSKDVSSLRNNAGAQPVTTDGIKLASDKSGNSSTNAFIAGVGTGNYGLLTVGTAIGTGDFSISKSFLVPPVAATNGPAAAFLGAGTVVSSTNGLIFDINTANGNVNVGLYASTGNFRYNQYASLLASYIGQTVTLTLTRAAGTWTLYLNAASQSPTSSNITAGTAPAFTATVDSTQMMFGCSASGVASTIANFPVFKVRAYSAALDAAGVLADYNGTVQANNIVNVDFTAQAKLATSFIATSGQTVTITTSGATGARISGARDLYQGTAANQPILTIAASGNYLTFDGSNDYLKSAAFSLSQPETVYFVGSQVTWTSGDIVYDGNSGSERMIVGQQTGSPQLQIFGGTTYTASVSPTLATNIVLSSVFNAASSSNRLNRNAAATGNPGASAANGFTLGGAFNGSVPASFTAQEVLVYSGAHDKATQERVIAMLARNNRIALT